MRPPIAKKNPHSTNIHNETLIDNYHWLRDYKWPDVKQPDVLEYLNQENAYYHSIMDPYKTNEEKLYQEMIGRIKLADSTVPIKKDNYFYYSRTEEKSNYSIYCRKKDSVQKTEEVILDVNILAESSSFFNLGDISVSPDHKLLAYSSDTTGGERFIILVKDLTTEKLLSDKVDHSIGEIVWHENGQGFFYAKLSENWRTEEIYYHLLGTEQSEDKLIYKETDPLFMAEVEKSQSKRFILINTGSKESNEIRFIDCNEANLEPKLLLARRDNHLYFVEHHGDDFYITTNDKGKNFRLVRASLANYVPANWHEIIAYNKDSYICHVAVYRDRFVGNYFALIKIITDRDGNIVSSNLKQSTGNQVIDSALINMIEAANPVPTPPKNYYSNDEQLGFIIPITTRVD